MFTLALVNDTSPSPSLLPHNADVFLSSLFASSSSCSRNILIILFLTYIYISFRPPHLLSTTTSTPHLPFYISSASSLPAFIHISHPLLLSSSSSTYSYSSASFYSLSNLPFALLHINSSLLLLAYLSSIYTPIVPCSHLTLPPTLLLL